MKITYYLDIFSSWCTMVEPVWDALKEKYAGRADFEWKIALMRAEDFPTSREQCDWFYRRSGSTCMRLPYMLDSGWFEPSRKDGYAAANLVAEAARELGFPGEEIRRALAHAGLREGQKIGELDTAVAIAVKAGGHKLTEKQLRAAAGSAAVRERAEASTKEFFAHQIDQRPAFVIADSIGDKAVFSGLIRIEPLVATVEAMFADTAAYAAHAAHYGKPPA